MEKELDQESADKCQGAKGGRLNPLVRRFGYQRHPHPIIRKSLPEEIQVGWQFEDASGARRFVAWGCTRNRESLKGLIEDVQLKHGPIEIIDLDVPNNQILPQAANEHDNGK